MDTIEKLYIYIEGVNNNQINDKQWHRTKWLKPKKILSKLSHTSPYCCIYCHKYIAGSDNTHHLFKIVPSKNYKTNYFNLDTFLTYITHNYTVPSIFVYSVKYKCTNTHTQIHFRSRVLYGFCA